MSPADLSVHFLSFDEFHPTDNPRVNRRQSLQSRSADPMSLDQIRVAAAHVAPVFLDATATVEKPVGLIAQAAKEGASLVAFPESFIPGFPVWTAVHAPIRTHEAFAAFATASILADGPEIVRVRQAAARHGVFVSLGFSERNPASVGGLWNSNLLI